MALWSWFARDGTQHVGTPRRGHRHVLPAAPPVLRRHEPRSTRSRPSRKPAISARAWFQAGVVPGGRCAERSAEPLVQPGVANPPAGDRDAANRGD
jgi:hypothetical protein